jgi:hypothetical protein
MLNEAGSLVQRKNRKMEPELMAVKSLLEVDITTEAVHPIWAGSMITNDHPFYLSFVNYSEMFVG